MFDSSQLISESLRIINSSPENSLSHILRMICNAVGCEYGVVFTVDKQRNQLALDVMHGYSPEVIRHYRSARLTFNIDPPEQSVSTEAYLNARDTGVAQPLLVSGGSQRTHRISAEPIKWVLCFPIASMGEWVAVFTLESLEDSILERLAGNEDGIKLLNVYSDVISMALAFRQSLVFGFDEFIGENEFTDIKTLSAKALSWVFEKFRVNSCAIYFATYDNGQSYVSCTGAFINKKFEADVPYIRYEIGEGFAGWVALTQHSLILTEVDNEESIELGNYGKQFGSQPQRSRKLAARNPSLYNFKAYMGVPITDGRETVGVLEILDQEREYAFSDEGLLEMIARRIAIEYKRISQSQRRDTLFEISKFGMGDPETVIEDVMTTAMKAAGATHGFFMFKEGDGSFRPLSVRGHNLSASDIPLVARDAENLITWVMRELKEVNSADSRKEGSRPRDDIPPTDWTNSFKPKGFIPENIRSLLMVPVYLGSKIKKRQVKIKRAEDQLESSEATDSEIEDLGVLVLMSTKPNAFQQDEIVVTALAQIVSYHIWASKKTSELEVKNEQVSQLEQAMPMYSLAVTAAAVSAGTVHTARKYINDVVYAIERLRRHAKTKDDRELSELTMKIVKPFEELTELYDRLHDIFGGIEPRFEVCNIAGLLQEVRTYMDPVFRSRRFEFRVQIISGASVNVKADPILMKVVFINLIKNSIDAGARRLTVTAKNATLTDWHSSEGPAIEIIFDDDGIGIPEEYMARVFSPFVTANKKGGTGLGLAVNSDILDRHRGEIRIIRSKLGQGTTISLKWPIDHALSA